MKTPCPLKSVRETIPTMHLIIVSRAKTSLALLETRLYTIYPIVALGLAAACSAFRPSARASKGILHTRNENAGPYFRTSTFYQVPLLALSTHNKDLIGLACLLSINCYKVQLTNCKLMLALGQSTKSLIFKPCPGASEFPKSPLSGRLRPDFQNIISHIFSFRHQNKVYCSFPVEMKFTYNYIFKLLIKNPHRLQIG